MILNEINHKMPIFRDCTLGEILLVGAICLLIPLIGLSIIFKLLTGYAFIGAAISFVIFYPLTRFMLSKLQKIKYGKPYAYFKHALIKKLIQLGLYDEIFIVKHQKWSVVRKKK